MGICTLSDLMKLQDLGNCSLVKLSTFCLALTIIWRPLTGSDIVASSCGGSEEERRSSCWSRWPH